MIYKRCIYCRRTPLSYTSPPSHQTPLFSMTLTAAVLSPKVCSSKFLTWCARTEFSPLSLSITPRAAFRSEDVVASVGGRDEGEGGGDENERQPRGERGGTDQTEMYANHRVQAFTSCFIEGRAGVIFSREVQRKGRKVEEYC